VPRLIGNNAETVLRKRLRLVAERHSQAEIARRTGESTANVSRYLRSNRIPATFTSAVVAGLGVNPSWLLTGEGTPWLADVSAAQGDMARNLLELVQSMAAVSRVKLGALAGRNDAKALRELDDALRSFERIRSRLNEQTAEVFGQLMDGLQHEIEQRKEGAARTSMKSIEQIARLCDDPELQLRRLRMEARFHFEFGDLPTALELQRAVFYRVLARGHEIETADVDDAVKLVVSLESVGRFREALGFVRAVQAILETTGREPALLPRLSGLEGRLLLSLRELGEALRVLHRAIAGRANANLTLQIAYCWAGTLSLDEFRRSDPRDDVRADFTIRLALWTEDADLLRATLADLERARLGATDTPRLEPAVARALLAALAGDKSAPAQFEQALEAATYMVHDRPPWNVSLPSWRCQLYRLVGNRKQALHWLRATNEQVIEFDPALVLPPQVEVLHHRNALELIAPNERNADLQAMRRAAKEFFAAMLGRGYRMFEAYARQAGVI
jgi:transcriptional regulator with XRE-family HTH domain